MNGIIYPTVRLFIYDLRDGLGQDKNEIKQNQERFKKKLPEKVHESLFEFDDGFEEEYVPLLQREKYGVVRFTDSAGYYDGYYRPVRIWDNYGLLIDCSVKNDRQTYFISKIKEIKECIDRRLEPKSFTLGQTWMLLGYLPDYTAKQPEQIKNVAQDCYAKLMESECEYNWDNDYQGEGHFLGGTIFDLWQYRRVMKAESSRKLHTIQEIQENHHTIIALFPDRESLRTATEFNPDWMILFCYRSKIMWAYGQSSYLKQQLKKDFLTIQECSKELRGERYNLPIKKLQALLDKARNTLSRYGINLILMEQQIRTIEINLDNYKKLVNDIYQKANEEGLKLEEQINLIALKRILWLQSSSDLRLSNLRFLERFSQEVEEKYLLQVKKDYENLSPGLKLLESIISTIRATVEVEQAMRDRIFQNSITIAAAGLGFGSAVASISGHFPTVMKAEVKKREDNRFGTILYDLVYHPLGWGEDWLAPGISVIFTICSAAISAIFFAFIAWLSVQLWRFFSWFGRSIKLAIIKK